MTLPSLIACATCMGAPGHQLSEAANSAIIVMLWTLVGIGVFFGGLVWNLVSRARKYHAIHGIPSDPDALQDDLSAHQCVTPARVTPETRREPANVG